MLLLKITEVHVLKISVQESDINYDSCFQKFWQIESSETKAKDFSDYSKHVYFNGRKYETPLPWKKYCGLIPDNCALSESRLHSLIKRLKRDPVTLQEHGSILRKQESEGIFEEPPGKFKPAGTVHDLSHHPVIRTDKSTSRVRILYDASAKRDGPYLNDCLETGPNTLPQIIYILLRFRLNKIALITDIKQAFLNVSIPESDRHFSRFLWANDINLKEKEIIIRRCTRVAFGTTASQFLLASAISKHLSQYEKTYPLSEKKFLENLYVDDSINGGNSIEEAYHFYKKSKDCLLKGGFELRKFHSNNPSLLQKINQIENAVEPIRSEKLKVLGIE